ncbi:hypothetical protein BDV97DRAFT_357235 [Delphinella strobiligena]|nr:hypothetical protein BDV97DRAFT_357235 [Delphinella strobiligena]
MTHRNDVNNPAKFYYGFHKPQFDPPELMRGNGGWTNDPGNRRVMQSANVYQIGAVMLCAMRLQISPDPINAVPNVDGVPPRGLIRRHTTAGYSAGLKNLVHACLRRNEAWRIDPPTLLANIAVQGAVYFGPGTLETHQAAPASKPRRHRHKTRVSMSDTYRVGLRLANTPRQPQRISRGGRR